MTLKELAEAILALPPEQQNQRLSVYIPNDATLDQRCDEVVLSHSESWGSFLYVLGDPPPSLDSLWD